MKSIVRRVIDLFFKLYNYYKLSGQNIKVGRKLCINGAIVFGIMQGAELKIGDCVKINSGMRYNAIGGDTKTILVASSGGKIVIGNNVGISNTTIVSSESIVIGDDVYIGGSVKIYDTDFHWLDFKKRISERGGISKPVWIKKGAFIGAHSIILKGVTVGEKSIVGAGSVVSRSIPDGEIWAGNPARFLRKIDDASDSNHLK